MGIRLVGAGDDYIPCCGGSSPSHPNEINVNPDPRNFTILNEEYINGYLILLVKYPNCTNFEGHKLLVYGGAVSSKAILHHTSGKLDPHFSTHWGGPIARFRPCLESLQLIQNMIGGHEIQTRLEVNKL